MEKAPACQEDFHGNQCNSAFDSDGRAGIWFWDSTLPLAFASLRDCDTLFNHDPMSAKLISLVLNIDGNTRYTYGHGLLKKLNFSPSQDSYLFPAGADETTSKSLKTDSEVSSYTLIRQIESISEHLFDQLPDNSSGYSHMFLDKLNEYYDSFATAYATQNLFCRDAGHAGYFVKQVEAMQILNMICNQFMDLNSSYCCAK
jgi:hypothetical protein